MIAMHQPPTYLKSIALYGLGLLLTWGSFATVFAEEVKPTKPRIVARYSDSGIVSAEGQEKFKVYQYQQANGVTVFTDKAPSSSDYQILLYDCFACRPDSTIDWNGIRLFTRNYESLISRAAHKHRLDPALIRAVIHAESAFNARAISRSGAMGLMQLMPETAKEMGVTNAFLPEENILGGSKYLAQMLKQFNGDIALACAAYNAGPTTVTQYNGIPPYPETQAYVERVQILLKRYRSTKV
ncbi:lytic transglycosylase domain-containing protein [Shewanella xiamenensis]|jgi:soluble lytic murein transglycosylase-like protein|uniref:Lytic transglycosylase domain-containing protein n=1 Tax=Shewanella xiamenensis TaxID=332186 RepID=A0ABT6UHS5_9GAMM|nr:MULTISPECIES: lytic transglycosylase domain-containing protein [Shewanella]PZP38219.1 MAG: lytic transglycosylase domain-containing protein [Shewanella oneidensis]ASF16295.1 lytic transglycosylase domain-containing protein [Shewanella sp. FDAARGOS_354]KEK26734.1 transglycosylase [Shewanella xiamenensis]MBW0279584.1 lytic transglycosylase [Shewanella xiamenensis]MCD8551651.1 lytic transglycosylase domain-containing protein [Shewanella xiamenensis]